jgi:DNA-binding transcriptional regulator YiaG
LARRHLPLSRAHRLLTEAVETARGQFVEVPCVEDLPTLLEELRACGLTAHVAEGEVDVRAVRAATGLTQDRFALEYGLDPATLRNWEQGRTRPDLTARSYLRLIAEDPEGVRARRERAALRAEEA